MPGNTKQNDEKPLSKRELEIIVLAAKEFNSGEIASKLNIDIRTVETHRMRIMEKTRSKNFIGAIIFSLKSGYIRLEDL